MVRKSVLGALLLVLAGPAAAQWFASAGQAQYARGGGAGHWDQPPLPSEWKLKTGHVAIGYRAGGVEFALRDLGRAYVHGFYVPDADYAAGKTDGRVWRGIASQDTQAVSIAYSPRWGAVGLSVGALIYRQKSSFDIAWVDGLCCGTQVKQVRVGATPMIGVSVGHRFGPVRVEYRIEAAHRVRLGDAPAGGYGSRAGLVLQSITFTAEQ